MFVFHKECTFVSFVPNKNINVLVLFTIHHNDEIDKKKKCKFGVDIVEKM